MIFCFYFSLVPVQRRVLLPFWLLPFWLRGMESVHRVLVCEGGVRDSIFLVLWIFS